MYNHWRHSNISNGTPKDRFSWDSIQFFPFILMQNPKVWCIYLKFHLASDVFDEYTLSSPEIAFAIELMVISRLVVLRFPWTINFNLNRCFVNRQPVDMNSTVRMGNAHVRLIAFTPIHINWIKKTHKIYVYQ